MKTGGIRNRKYHSMLKLHSLRTKFILAFAALLVISLFIGASAFYSIRKIDRLTRIGEKIETVNQGILKVRRAELQFLSHARTNPEFIQTGKSDYLSQVNREVETITQKIRELKENDYIQDWEVDQQLNQISDLLNQYHQAFLQCSQLVKKRGFKDWGDEGQMRKAIHAVESSPFPYSKTLLLSLRRHEKDFMLRKDLKYKQKFDQTLARMVRSVEGQPVENREFERQQVLQYLKDYQKVFAEIIHTEQQIGLDENDGLQGQFIAAIAQLEPLLEESGEMVNDHIESNTEATLWTLLGIILSQIILGLFLAFLFSKRFSGKILELRSQIVALADGLIPEKSSVKIQDELGTTHLALNTLIDRIQTAADFAEKVGNGELNTDFDEKNRNGILAGALLSMQQKLQVTAKAEEQRIWTSEGMAKFGELMRINQDDLNHLGHELIAGLVNYVGANQGQIYMLKVEEREKPTMDLLGTYAWGRKKQMVKVLHPGEGLAGQAWMEKGIIHLKEVPENYVQISSGLGKSRPRSILIVPMINNDKVMGILEIASFSAFEPHQIDFVEGLGEVIAATFATIGVNINTKKLLEKAQLQAEEMRAQEEEMRQNQEELQATQEEMSRQKMELMEEIRALREEALLPDLPN